ncbi:RNA-directed DNA polymerase, eukaryota [Tanacetum coccineum]|uniref:RNA-directed DNA polymerase, eukaryota n=1 Tax=Tanacetum coccineum TaxID=301880 RepID=A0ABQ5AYW7_9ASTR
MKNNSVCKENGSNVFRKEREQYHEIQDLKAQMQDKNIAISELKKLIEMFKRKGVDTNFEQPSILGKPPVQSIRNQPVVRQPTAYKYERYQCPQQRFASQVGVSNKLTKLVTPHSWHQIKESSLAKPNDLIAPGPFRNRPKQVSLQSPREKVGSNDMVHNYYLEKAKKTAQLQKDKDVNGKPSMINPARLPNTANGCKPKPRNWQASMSSRVSNKDVHLGEHRKQKPFLKFNDLQCPTCKKCLYSANHDECVLEYLSRLNPRASAQNKDAKSHKTTKRYMPVEKSSASKKPERQIPTGHRFSNKKTTNVPEKTMTPRSCLRWKQTGKIFKTVGLRWVPTGKLFNSCTGKVDSEPTHGSIVDIPHIHACKQTLNLSAGSSFNGQKQQRIDLNADALYNEKLENLRVCSGLVLHQMTSDHNSSELGIHDHSNEPSSSKLVPKVVPLAVKTATSRQELELLFHHHIAMLRTTEPDDLPKDNPKLEIAVLRKHFVNLDDDIIDEEDPIPHDLADSDDEDLVNLDIDDGMSADVARGHGGDGGGDDRPPSHHIPTGCGGCLGNRGKGTRKPNLGGRRAGRQHTRQETRNLGLKAITDKSGPVSIRFEFGDRETLMPLGEHAAHWANYLGELVRELPLHYPSWRQVPAEQKAGVMARIGTQFDMRPHMESDRWPLIYAAIQQHLQKIYNGKKAALKERHWIPDSDGTYDLERIRLSRPSHISEVNWDAQIAFWNDPKNRARATQNKQNRAKSKVVCRQGSRSIAALRDMHMESSATREYPSLIHTFFLTHTVNGVFLNPEDKALYEEMLRLQGLGSNTETGVPYTEDEIMAIVRGGKQRGHIPGVGRVLPGQGTVIPPPPPCTHSSDVVKLKKREKVLTRQVNMFMKLFRSDDKFSQMLTQLESQPEIGGGSGSGGRGDDEQGDDEDDGEDGEDEDDS